MLDAAGQALLILVEPHRLLILGLGVVLGLVIGILPGIGGLAAIALLLPFTFTMDPFTAFAFLLGLGAVGGTGDPIPAILFGVPGGSGSQATVIDGLEMTKRGEGGRALSAAYMSSLLGGLFGAAVLAISLPVLRPVVLYVGSPELLAFAIFGISMVAVLSGRAPLRGLAMACFGVMLSMIGTDPQTGTFRWTMGQLYLWDGLPLVPALLGLFAVPELCDLLIKRTALAQSAKFGIGEGMLRGAKDAFTHWWLVMRCSAIGAVVGALPGLGASVVSWLAYGHAIQSEKGAQKTFGSGDVRGVIAPEAANNATEGGALVPTIAFGVPGSASMAILLGAFLMHGLIPGPDMLTKNLSITYSMIWSLAIANVLGTGLCYLFSGQFARLSTLRYTLILPSVIAIMFIGAYQASSAWGDVYTLVLFGALGWAMKQLKWPRPPLVLGFVLGSTVERYLFVSIQRYGLDWLMHPLVIVLLSIAVLTLLRPLSKDVRRLGGLKGLIGQIGRPLFHATDLFYVFIIITMGVMLSEAVGWNGRARAVPMIVGVLGLGFATVSLVSSLFLSSIPKPGRVPLPELAKDTRIHMDLASDTDDMAPGAVVRRAGIFFGWLVAFMASMAAIGLIPTVPIFVIAFMRLENREPWKLVLPQAILLAAFIYVVFANLLTLHWPQTLLGSLVPALKVIPSI